MKKLSVLNQLPVALAITAGLSMPVFADDAPTTSMDTVVVTASRTEQKLADTLNTTTVISRDDIDRIQPRDFTDLLRREVGIDYSSTGGKGSTSGLFMRGTNSNQVVILVDGARINAVSNGAATLELIDMEDIDHIEIVRGPASSLYGNDAIGGVIQIFTRKGNGDPSTTVKTGFGTNAESLGSVITSGEVDGTHYKAAVSYNETNGINNTNKNSFSYDRDHDAYRNAGVSLAVSHDFDGGHEAGITFNQNEGETEFDRGYMDFDTQTLTGHAKLQLRDNLQTALTLANSYDKQDTPAFTSQYDTHRDSALWQTDWQANENHLFTAGAEYVEESLDTDQGYTDDSRYNRALFIQDQMQFGRHAFQIAVRNDDSSQYGSEDTWNTAYGFDLTDSLKLFANYGTAFKAPSFNDLYFPYTDFCAGFGFVCASTGNPALEAEQSRSGEIGIKSQAGNSYWSASVYKTKIEDLISWQEFTGPGPFDSTWRPVNVDDATIEGIDLTAGTALGDWRFATRASFLNPKDDNTGKRLLRRSKRMAGVDIDRDFGDKFSAGASWNAQGGRTDSNNEYDHGFNTVDVHASYTPVDSLKITLSVANMFDVDYTVAYGYETQGVNAMLTAAFTF